MKKLKVRMAFLKVDMRRDSHLRRTGRERGGIRRRSVPDTLRFSLLPALRVALAMKEAITTARVSSTRKNRP